MELSIINVAKYGRAPPRDKRMPKVYALIDSNDETTILDDDEDLENEARSFFAKLFRESENTSLPRSVFRCWPQDRLEDLPHFDVVTLINMLFNMAKGKTGAKDMIVIEMLQELADDILQVVLESFYMRLMNHPSESKDDSWDEVVANLIPKVNRPESI